MPCCGRPNNRATKGGGEAEYYQRHTFLTAAQKAKQQQLGVSNCKKCDALTIGDPCNVCGNPKPVAKEKEGL